MAYDHPEPLKKGEYFVSYPHMALEWVNNEKKFKEYLVSYLVHNEPCSVAVGITKDHKLVCKENPENTLKMVNARHAESKAPKKKGAKKK